MRGCEKVVVANRSGPQRLKILRENSVLEGHDFSRAVNDTAMDGFSR
jgi:hypothetical protein